MEDQKILELLWDRSDSAIDALSNSFGHRLYQTAINILNSPQDAEEVVNDTYLALWNTIPPERPLSLAGYVHRTGRNLALKKLRFSLHASKKTDRAAARSVFLPENHLVKCFRISVRTASTSSRSSRADIRSTPLRRELSCTNASEVATRTA